MRLKLSKSSILLLAALFVISSAVNLYSKPAQQIDYKKYEKGAKIEPVLQSGHSDSVYDIAFSPDGKYIASSSKDETVKLQTLEGKVVKIFKGYMFSYSPDGRFIASSATTGINLWSIDGKLQKAMKGPTATRVKFSPDGKYIVAGYTDNKARLWTIDGKLLKTLEGHTSWISGIAISPDSKIIATTGSNDCTIKLWTIDGKLLKTIEDVSSNNVIWSLSISSDGKYIATGSDDKSIKLWTVDGELLKTMTGHSSGIKSVAFSPDGKYIASGSNDNKVMLWTIDGELLKTMTGHSSGVRSVTFSPDGKYIASGSEDNSIKLWGNDGRIVRTFDGNSWAINNIAFSSDKKFIVSGSIKCVQLWSMEGKIIKTIKGHFGRSDEQMRLSPDGKYFVSESGDDTIKLWTIDGKHLKTIPHRSGKVNAKVFSPDSRYIASGSWDGPIKIWDINGNLIKTLDPLLVGPNNNVQSIAFSKDNKYIAAVTYNEYDEREKLMSLKIWNIEGELVTAIKNFPGSIIAFSPDGNYLVSGSKYEPEPIKLWSIDGKLLKTLDGHSAGVFAIVFSQDGKYIASGSFDRTIKLWDKEGNCIKTFNISPSISNIAFSYDNKFLVIGLMKGGVSLFNLQNDRSISLSSAEDDNWFIFDNKNHFDCSPNGRNSILFVKGLTPYQPDQFWDKFYTPGLMSRFMGSETLPDIDLNNVSKNTPDVTISSDTEPKTDKKQATIRVSAKGDGGIGKIFLYHNGRILDEEARGFKVKQTGKFREFTVDLADGENQFTGAAFDRSSSAEGRSEKLVIVYTPEQIVKPDIYILAVGVSEYKDINIRLKSPNADARVISDTLKKVASGIYGNVNVSLLTDNEASKSNISNAIDDISNKCGKSDTVILFFAGHGDTENEGYYYLPYDADITSLKKSAVSITDLSDYVRKIPAGKVALFLDTCKSGSAVKSLGQIAFARGYDERKMIANLAKSKGIAVFSASNESQSAYEIKALGHGIFTWCFIDAINNRRDDITINGAITMSKLLGVVNQATRETADKYLKIEQSPVLYIFGDDFAIGK